MLKNQSKLERKASYFLISKCNIRVYQLKQNDIGIRQTYETLDLDREPRNMCVYIYIYTHTHSHLVFDQVARIHNGERTVSLTNSVLHAE